MNAIKARRPVDREKNITKISFVNDDISDLAIPKSFGSDTRSLGQAIRKTRRGSSLLETITEAVDVQSVIVTRMRELASQSASGVIGNVEQEAIGSHFSALQEELNETQNLLVRSVKTLNVTMENLCAADSTIRETNFTEKVAVLTKNRLHSTAPVAKKEQIKLTTS